MRAGGRARSRRALVAGGLGFALGADARAQSRSQLSQQQAGYQPLPKNRMSCALCTFFRPPAACQVVEGTIGPQGWCRLFDLPD